MVRPASSARHLERLCILTYADVSPDPVRDVQLNFLCSLDLVTELALPWVIPHFKVPQLKVLRTLLPTKARPPTVADLLPALCLRKSLGYGSVSNSITVAVTRLIAHTSPTEEFFTTTSFSFVQIKTLTLNLTTKLTPQGWRLHQSGETQNDALRL